MLTGTISHWVSEKGFGFIVRDDHEPDVFVHIRNVAENVDELPRGKRVTFEVGTDERRGKPEARNVRLA